jgi:hypothetical protein
MIARRPAVLLSLMLAACSSDPSLPTPAYMPPSPPTEQAIVAVIPGVAAEAKLTGPLKVSAVRPTDIGPGRYFCLPETGGSNHCQAPALLRLF